MADRDSFIDEVSEELRRDRMLRLWRRWGPWVIGAIVLAVAAAGAASWWEQEKRIEAREAGSALIEATKITDPAQRATALDALAARSEPGAALAARMAAAAALAEAGDRTAAATAYEAIESDGAIDPLYRGLAGFKAVLLRAPDLDPAARQDALAPFLTETSPWRLMALEARAAARLEAGDMDGARADLEAALEDPMASPGLRQRAGEMIKLTGGGEG